MAARLSQYGELYQLQVTIPAGAEEAASAILESLFAQWPVSFRLPDSDHAQLSLFLPANQRPSRPQIADLNVRLRELTAFGVPAGRPKVRVTRLTNRNWKESWKRHFKPLEIGHRLLIRPSWSRRRAKRGQTVLVIDPGLSFGTGQHPTTSFCLRELARARTKGAGQSLLDIGTGSGILALAAAKLGYEPVLGFDCDPESVRVASANARRNRLHHVIRFSRKDVSRLPGTTHGKWDVVCANLLADLLMSEARKIVNRVKPGGVLIIAGILRNEFGSVEKQFVPLGVQRLRTRTEGEWRSGSYRVPA